MAAPRTTDAAPLRALRLAEALFGRILDGYSNTALSDALGYPAYTVSRDLDALRQAGWAQQMDNGRWCLTTRPVALMRKYQDYMADLAARRDAFDARVQSQAKQI